MVARARVTSNGLPPSRTRVRVIFWPILPRILSTASVMVWPRVGWPLILTIRSPAWMPALDAGVSSIGETTLMAIFGADFNAQATELTAGAFLQLGEIFRAEVSGVRVEVAEHALDGIFQQGLVVYGFDIGCLDPVHDLGKGAQLVQRQRRLGGRGRASGCSRCGLVGESQRRADHQSDRQGQRSEAGQMQHVERTPNVDATLSLGAAPLCRIARAALLTNSEVQRRGVLAATVTDSGDGFTGFYHITCRLE